MPCRSQFGSRGSYQGGEVDVELFRVAEGCQGSVDTGNVIFALSAHQGTHKSHAVGGVNVVQVLFGDGVVAVAGAGAQAHCQPGEVATVGSELHSARDQAIGTTVGLSAELL